MGMRPLTEHLLKPADWVEVTVLVDNYIDILHCPRLPWTAASRLPGPPDHGRARVLLPCPGRCRKTRAHGPARRRALRDCMPRNAREPGVDLHAVEAVVLSHGHFDHTGGLSAVFCGAGRQVPLVVHPDAFLQRRMNGPKGIRELPAAGCGRTQESPAPISCSARGPRPLRPGHLLVTGEVERKTSFGKGMPGMEDFTTGAWDPDPIATTRRSSFSDRTKGLVVISGCAHAGIVNTVEYARRSPGPGMSMRSRRVPPHRAGICKGGPSYRRCGKDDRSWSTWSRCIAPGGTRSTGSWRRCRAKCT